MSMTDWKIASPKILHPNPESCEYYLMRQFLWMWLRILRWELRVCVCVCVCESLSHVRLFAIPCTVVHQAPLSTEFWKQEYWGRLPFPTPGGSSQPRDATCVSWNSCICRWVLYHGDPREAPMILAKRSLSEWAWNTGTCTLSRGRQKEIYTSPSNTHTKETPEQGEIWRCGP